MQYLGESFATRTKEIENNHQNYEDDDGEIVEKKKSKHKKHEHRHKKSKQSFKGSISPAFIPKNDHGSH